MLQTMMIHKINEQLNNHQDFDEEEEIEEEDVPVTETIYFGPVKIVYQTNQEDDDI